MKVFDNVEEYIDTLMEYDGDACLSFYLKDEYVFSGISKVIEEDYDYGKSTIGNNEKINIEFVSANPTGILHLGTARGAAYGANLANVAILAIIAIIAKLAMVAVLADCGGVAAG